MSIENIGNLLDDNENQSQMMIDEFSFADSDDDITFTSDEINLLNEIRNQIANVYGDFTGEEDNTFDHILDYIHDTHHSDYTLIDNFEPYCQNMGNQNIYDLLTFGLIDVFKKLIGVNIDVNRENIYFSDLYDIYCVFVLGLKSTLENCTINHYLSTGLDLKDIKKEAITEYCLSDEFSSNDDLIHNAAEYSQDLALLNLRDKINDHSISIDHEVFSKYIYDFIIHNDIKISEKVLNG